MEEKEKIFPIKGDKLIDFIGNMTNRLGDIFTFKKGKD